jgi:uncharacterized lipoprotein YmbA
MNKMLRLLPAISLTLLVGCVSAPTRLHTLQPQAGGASPAAYDGPPVRVAAVTFPADIDRVELVTEDAGGNLKVNDLDHWAAPLSKLAQQTLTGDLLGRLPPGKVAFPQLPAGGPVAELRVDILRLPSGGASSMAASWEVTLDSHTQRLGVVHLPDEARGWSAEAEVQHLSTLLARLADEIAAALTSSVATGQ